VKKKGLEKTQRGGYSRDRAIRKLVWKNEELKKKTKFVLAGKKKGTNKGKKRKGSDLTENHGGVFDADRKTKSGPSGNQKLKSNKDNEKQDRQA